MALSSLVSSLKVALTWTAQKALTGSAYSAIENSSTVTKTVTGGTAAANAALGGADELASFVQSISASGSATIDLTSLTNILATTGVSLARVKFIVIQLLSEADDAVVGTAASYITIGNNGSNDFVSTTGSGWLKGATSEFDVPNGGFIAFGAGTAGGVTVSGTKKIIKIANGDGSLAAKVQITIAGGTT